MAIDQTEVAKNIASTTVQQAERFVKALEILELLYKQGSLSGINMTDYDNVFLNGAEDASPELMHVDGSTLNKVLADVVVDFRTWLQTETAGGKTYEQLLYSTCNVIIGNV